MTGTNFIAGVTTVSFGANITVNTTTVDDPTQITANITIANGAALGARNVTVTNPAPGGGTATSNNGFTVTAANSAPSIAANNASRTVNEGQIATNTGTWSDAQPGDTITLTASVGTVIKSGTNASGTWSWSFGTNDGPAQGQTVTITANDGNGGITSTNFSLVVDNVAPTATFNAPASVNEGSPINLSLSSPLDPSTVDTAAGFTYAFDCGSGYGSFSGTTSASCPTTDNGTRTVKGKIRDKDGGVNEYTASVTINNVAPTASLSNDGPVDEGSPATITFSAASDPSSADTSAGFRYTFDCSGTDDLAASYAAAGATDNTTCTFNDNGTFTVFGRIFERTTATPSTRRSSPSTTWRPENVEGGNDQTVNEGDLVSLSGSFTDPGSADTHTFVWHVVADNGQTITDGTGQTFSFTPDDNGSYAVTFTVTDDDGGANSDNFTVTVDNVGTQHHGRFRHSDPIDEGVDDLSSRHHGDSVSLARRYASPTTFDCDNDLVYEQSASQRRWRQVRGYDDGTHDYAINVTRKR